MNTQTQAWKRNREQGAPRRNPPPEHLELISGTVRRTKLKRKRNKPSSSLIAWPIIARSRPEELGRISPPNLRNPVPLTTTKDERVEGPWFATGSSTPL